MNPWPQLLHNNESGYVGCVPRRKTAIDRQTDIDELTDPGTRRTILLVLSTIYAQVLQVKLQAATGRNFGINEDGNNAQRSSPRI